MNEVQLNGEKPQSIVADFLNSLANCAVTFWTQWRFIL